MSTEARVPAPADDPTTGVPTEPRVASTLRESRRRRRPSGAPAPLPRDLGATGKLWLVASAALLVLSLITFGTDWGRHFTSAVDSVVLRGMARLRTDWLTNVMEGIDRVGSGWGITVVASALILALVALKRWRHLFTFLASLMVLALIGGNIYQAASRPRPYDVTIIGRWTGWSFPAPPPAVAALLLLAITYSLVVPGRARSIAKWVVTVLIAIFVVAELYLALYHPFDVVVGLALAVAITVNAFRYFTPNEVFPVTYRRGKTAHLDIEGRRGEAIRQAVKDQLGLTVRDIEPVGLEGSGGSTPLRIRVEGDPDSYLFGKLYAMNHVRADRWYKLGRTILYGRLEDEARFQSVRRLVQYEDYAVRLLRDSGIPTAAPYGFVEMTPEREYLLVTEFIEGATEIGEATVDDGVIDEGLSLVRKLWDVGLSHRDIKPANLMVRDGHILLIDAAFLQIRPSPWRQAVDLANMMLVLALRTDARRVYEAAKKFFTEDEVAEAFAAARGVASPTQLRSAMKQDGRDLLTQFRAMAPERQPISLQRWNVRRVVLTLGLVCALLLGSAAAGALTFDLLSPSRNIEVLDTPTCGTSDVMILMAQSVPAATSVPCIGALPAGWELGGIAIDHDESRFWLHSDLGGDRAVEATLLPPGRCDRAGATEVPSDEVGVRRFERVEQLRPQLRGTRYYTFDGGCVTYRFAFEGDASTSLLFDADTALTFQPRDELVDAVRERTGRRLCGAAVECPGGAS